MNKSELRQCCLDVERLRKAADRMDHLEAEYANALLKLNSARAGLKAILSLSYSCSCDIDDMDRALVDIHDRALDTLRIIE